MSEELTEAAHDALQYHPDRMPPASHKKPFSLRMDPEQHEAYGKAAEAIGKRIGIPDLSMAKWILMSLDAAAAKAGFPVVTKPRKRRSRTTGGK